MVWRGAAWSGRRWNRAASMLGNAVTSAESTSLSATEAPVADPKSSIMALQQYITPRAAPSNGPAERPCCGAAGSRPCKFRIGHILNRLGSKSSPHLLHGRRVFSGPARFSAARGTSAPEDDSLGRCAFVPSPGEREDATERLQQEFNDALSCFEDAPESLSTMPKINPNGVFANHNLRLDLINVYGFDFDYTLAHYSENLQPLIYNLAKESLVKEYQYPEKCLRFEYDATFPIRGLYYDKKTSYLLKLDFFHCVESASCFFGRRRLSRAEVDKAYGGKHISIETMQHLVPLMDLFCLSEVCLLSDVIQHFVDEGLEFDAAYVYEDVRRSVERIHISGLLHRIILEEPEKYFVKNEAVREMLKILRAKGKKTFIITNSPFPFINGGMSYLFDEDWRELFDVVIALSDKPNFYSSERPFRHYDIEKNRPAFERVESFLPHDVYYHGCLKDFLKITKWRGNEVLYFGDHLFSDLRGPAKAGWRTAAIIRELEREIQTQNEDNYRIHQARYHMVQELLGKYHGLPVGPRRDKEKFLLLALRKERQNARLAMSHMFNKFFGSTFLTDTGKESAFAYNVQKYADVYTSRLENLTNYSSEAWLYTPFDVKVLPHHIKVGPAKVFKNWPYDAYQA